MTTQKSKDLPSGKTSCSQAPPTMTAYEEILYELKQKAELSREKYDFFLRQDRKSAAVNAMEKNSLTRPFDPDALWQMFGYLEAAIELLAALFPGDTDQDAVVRLAALLREMNL